MSRRRPLAAVLALLATALTLSASASAAGRFTVTPQSDSAAFPNRTYVLTLPDGVTPTDAAVHVTENGQAVARLQVSPMTDMSDVGEVLVIDASQSMHGKPIASAMAAARAFARQRDPRQPLSVIVFNDQAHVVLPFTTDSAKIDAALATTPTLGTGTHILDATDQALDELAQQRIGTGSVVVLSDGADTGSTAAGNDVSAHAKSLHARVFTVGLVSNTFDPSTLEGLAAGSGGAYTEAGSASQLNRIYDKLGSQLANQYALSYTSTAPAGGPVSVDIAVQGFGSQSLSYTAPALPKVAAPAYHRSQWSQAMGSWITAVVVATVVALLIVYAIIAITQPRSRALRRRVAPFVPETERAQSSSPAVTSVIYEQTERALGATSWWGRFSEEVELSGASLSPAQMFVVGIAGGLLLGCALAALTGSWIMLIFCPVIPVVGRIWVGYRADRTRFAFATQLPDNLQVLASALRAGHSLVGALAVMTDDAAEPSRGEFRRLLAEERVGVPVDQSLADISVRMRSREVMQIALVTVVQQQTGGNTAEILDQVAANVRARFELRRLVKTLTAQGRVSRWIVTALPIALFLLILVINPSYVHPLLYTTGGQLLMIIGGCMTVAGSFAISKIVQVEV
jgi:tight adherence protein B